MGVIAKSVGSSFAPIGGTSGRVNIFTVGGSMALSAVVVPSKDVIGDLDVAFASGMHVRFASDMTTAFARGTRVRFRNA